MLQKFLCLFHVQSSIFSSVFACLHMASEHCRLGDQQTIEIQFSQTWKLKVRNQNAGLSVSVEGCKLPSSSSYIPPLLKETLFRLSCIREPIPFRIVPPLQFRPFETFLLNTITGNGVEFQLGNSKIHEHLAHWLNPANSNAIYDIMSSLLLCTPLELIQQRLYLEKKIAKSSSLHH